MDLLAYLNNVAWEIHNQAVAVAMKASWSYCLIANSQADLAPMEVLLLAKYLCEQANNTVGAAKIGAEIRLRQLKELTGPAKESLAQA